MAQKGLHHTQIGAVVQEVAGESVAEHMGTDLVGAKARRACEALQLTRQMLPRQMPAISERWKQPLRLGGARQVAESEKIGDCAARSVVERHQAFLVALAADHNDACIDARRRARSGAAASHCPAARNRRSTSATLSTLGRAR